MSKGRRPANETPTIHAPLPDCPDWLDPIAMDEWERVVPLLDLTALDLAILAAYCQTYARWKQAEKQISEEGQTLNGKKHPATVIAGDCLKQLRPLVETLGFTPAARGRLKNATNKPTEKATELEAFVDG